jgi:hypothetical protein
MTPLVFHEHLFYVFAVLLAIGAAILYWPVTVAIGIVLVTTMIVGHQVKREREKEARSGMATLSATLMATPIATPTCVSCGGRTALCSGNGIALVPRCLVCWNWQPSELHPVVPVPLPPPCWSCGGPTAPTGPAPSDIYPSPTRRCLICKAWQP